MIILAKTTYRFVRLTCYPNVVSCTSDLRFKMDPDAAAYEELNQPQYEMGCKFVNNLKLVQGAKVLDMGCGTGGVTKYIADIVGPDGEAVGFDPDEARIKIAQDKFKEVGNLKFHVGDSLTGFPHGTEPYYDVHITTHAIQWFPHNHKKMYLQKVHQSLKSGGKLAILTIFKLGSSTADNHGHDNMHALSQDEFQKLFEELGLFTNAMVEPEIYTAHFNSYELFKNWVKASTHRNLDEYDQAFVKKLMADCATFHEHGGVDFKIPCISIIACKE